MSLYTWLGRSDSPTPCTGTRIKSIALTHTCIAEARWRVARAVWNIYRYAFFSVIRILLTVIRIWYAYQKRWYIYHLTSSIRMGVHIAQRCETHTALAFKLTVHV